MFTVDELYIVRSYFWDNTNTWAGMVSSYFFGKRGDLFLLDLDSTIVQFRRLGRFCSLLDYHSSGISLVIDNVGITSLVRRFFHQCEHVNIRSSRDVVYNSIDSTFFSSVYLLFFASSYKWFLWKYFSSRRLVYGSIGVSDLYYCDSSYFVLGNASLYDSLVYYARMFSQIVQSSRLSRMGHIF